MRKTLKAEERKIVGRKVKTLRKQGFIPANLYGKKIKSVSLQIKNSDFQKIWKEAGETTLIDILVGEKIHPVLIHNAQIHPTTQDFIHVDFHEVSLTEKTTARIPVEITGESPAVSQGLGALIQPLSEIEVEALPADLPENFTIDISKLEQVDSQITVGEIAVNAEKIKILIDPSEIVVKVGALQKEEIPAPVPAETEGETAPGSETPAVAPEENSSNGSQEEVGSENQGQSQE